MLEGFASNVFVVKNEPQEINVRRFIGKTKNIENRAWQTRGNRDFATGSHKALGELDFGPYKTRALPNLVQVVF